MQQVILLRVLLLSGLLFYTVLTGADQTVLTDADQSVYRVPTNCRHPYCLEYAYEYKHGDVSYELFPFRSYGLDCENYPITEREMKCNNKNICMYVTPIFKGDEKDVKRCKVVEIKMPNRLEVEDEKLVTGKYYKIDGTYYNERRGTKTVEDFLDDTPDPMVFCRPKLKDPVPVTTEEQTDNATEQEGAYVEPCILKRKREKELIRKRGYYYIPLEERPKE